MKAPTTTPRPFIFVLMPFDDRFSDIYKYGIKGAAEDVEAYAERLDEQLFDEGMLDRVFNQISKADVIVADMTGRNPNVFYEVGYAHALGKITLLLTQNAEDIPFDLKHRQHTVYSGSIDTLRTELAGRLRWAIEESKRRIGGLGPVQISVRVADTEVPPDGGRRDIPTIRCAPRSRFFEIALTLQNESYNVLPPISHVYLFSPENSLIAPCKIRNVKGEGSNSQVGAKRLAMLISPPFLYKTKVRAADVEDGLVDQFHLDLTTDSIPPKAVEVRTIQFAFKAQADTSNSRYKLRIHTASQYVDYVFHLLIETPDAQRMDTKTIQTTDEAQTTHA